jgi:hypothetical protein
MQSMRDFRIASFLAGTRAVLAGNAAAGGRLVPKRGPRSADSYRGARRNAARGLVWSPQFYFEHHDRSKEKRRTVLSRKPSKYHPRIKKRVAAS